MASVNDNIELLRDTLSSHTFALSEAFERRRSQSRDFWIQLTASMDTLEDAQQAIDAFFEDSSAFASDDAALVGQKYLRLYGLLQAMFLQQDAVTNMLEAVDLGRDPISELEHEHLKHVRTIRNASVGHPTKLGGNRAPAHVFIVQVSMAATTFEYQVWRGNETDSEFVAVDLPDLRSRQAAAIETAISEIDEHLLAIAKDCELCDLNWWPGEGRKPG